MAIVYPPPNLSASLASVLASLATKAAKPATSDAIQYVSQNGNDANDGFSWGAGKLTVPAALAALSTGGKVKIGAGVFLVDLVTHPDSASYTAALVVPGFTTIEGLGRGITTIRLRDNQTLGNDLAGNNAIVMNRHLAAGGDEQITIQDITFDGNGANQTHNHGGVNFLRVCGTRSNRVRVTNCRGTSNSGSNETFHFEVGLSTDISYADCEAVSTAGSTASGFSADSSSNIKYVTCVAFGMTVGQGFTHNNCHNVQHSSCHSYLNGENGFNSEVSEDALYNACISGAVSAAAATYPYAASTSLGNTGGGFVINGSKAQVIGCAGRKNGAIGILWTGGSSGRLVAGEYTDNAIGLSVGGPDAPNIQCSGRPIISGNATTQVALPGGYENYYPDIANTPAVPASGISLTNPFPFDVMVYVTGGIVSAISVAGSVRGITSGAVRIPGGLSSGITLTYTAAPTWSWMMDS